MKIFTVPEAQQSILKRRPWDELDVPQSLMDGIQSIFGERLHPEEVVRRILRDVRQRGDLAILDWTRQIDRIEIRGIMVDQGQIQKAYEQIPTSVVEALRLSAARIEAFHRRQPTLSWFQNDEEGLLGQMVRPIDRVGVYAPGGTAPLPSSVLMSAIPARVAGVGFLSVVSPPDRATGWPHPATLVAADIAGVDEIYTAGGAQAIAALAFGTESISPVDKICGPGSLFTTLAKRQVYGIVGIDGLPGPTETVVIADDSADPQLVAADLLAQAEHDVLASAILLTPSRTQAEKVQAAVMSQMEMLDRTTQITASLANNSGIVLTGSIEEAIELSNAYAPEHLCLSVADPWSWLGQVRHAGGVFLGERSFEALGDYVAGPSHTMPTGGTARFASPTNVNDFVKIVSVIGLNDKAMRNIGPAAEAIARAEGLNGHADAVARRLRSGG